MFGYESLFYVIGYNGYIEYYLFYDHNVWLIYIRIHQIKCSLVQISTLDCAMLYLPTSIKQLSIMGRL